MGHFVPRAPPPSLGLACREIEADEFGASSQTKQSAMQLVRNLVWRQVESRVQAVITERLLFFRHAMIERGPIKPPRKDRSDTESPTSGYKVDRIRL